MRDDREPGDETLNAFVERLRVMPASDPRARAAILARVRGRRQAPWRAAMAWVWDPSVPVLAAAALVVAALGVGYAGRVFVEPVNAPASPEAGITAVPVTLVSNDANEARPVPTQFVFDAKGATRVAIVGDFNGWDATSALAVMQDPAKRGVWETTVMLPPGRHTYAFLVNDSLLKLDPRAPQADDPDFGRASSVILVTR